MDDNQIKKMFFLEETNWWYAGKRKILFRLFEKYFRNQNSPHFLDIGCGTGIILQFLSEYGKSYGLDASEKAISFCKQRGLSNVFLGSALKLPFENEFFSAVIILDVLEHIDEDMDCLKEVFRVLKKDGIIIISVPAFRWFFSYHDEALQHKRRYGKSGLMEKVKKTGFVILKITFTNFFIFIPVCLLRMLVKMFRINKQGSDTGILPSFLNSFLISIYSLESSLLKKVNLPWGLSLLCIAVKK
jgi:SAM-dependent methyltransferase